MSQLLLGWLDGVNLSRPVKNFEQDFSNGYLFCELLSKFGQLPIEDKFPGEVSDEYDVESKVRNFKVLERAFDTLKIKFTPTCAHQINNHYRGVALKLVFQIKMVLDQLAGVQQEEKLVKSITLPRIVYDRKNVEIFENRFRRTLENSNEVRKDVVQQRFYEERILQDQRTQELDRMENECFMADRARNRNILLEKVARNRSIVDQWHTAGVADWRTNMTVRMEAEGANLKFKQQTRRRDADRTASVREAATKTVINGIQTFESTLEEKGEERMPDDADTIMAHTTAGTELEFRQSITNRVPTAEAQTEEANEFMAKIKHAKVAGIQARKSREKRRRRVLVQLEQEQARHEQNFLEHALGDVLQRRSTEEARVDYQDWKTGQYEEVVRSNRLHRVEQYQARRKQDLRTSIDRDLELKQYMVAQLDEDAVREGVRYRALERGRMARRRANASVAMEEYLDQVTTTCISYAQQRQIGDREEVDPRLWDDWMEKVVNKEPLDFGVLKEDIARPYILSASFPPRSEVDQTDILANTQVPEDEVSQTEVTGILESDYYKYTTQAGQWALQIPEVDIAKELEEAGLGSETTLSFGPKLHPPARIGGANFRLGLIVEALISSCYPAPPPPMPEPMPEVPLRLVLLGKEFSGKRDVAFQLSEQYNLHIIVTDEVVREAMTLAGKPELSTLDEMRVSKEGIETYIEEKTATNNPHVRELQRLGSEIVMLLDDGGEITSECYVKLIIAKIRAHLADDPHHPYPHPPTKDAGDLPSFGWCLVGFPRTAQEASQLEWELSGFVAQKVPTEDEVKIKEAGWLAPCPIVPPVQVPPAIYGIDAIFRLVATNDQLTRRASGRRINPNTGLTYHVTDNVPPQKMRSKEDIVYEHLSPVDEMSFAMGTVTDRAHQADVRKYDLDASLENFGDESGPLLREITVQSMSKTYESVEAQVAVVFRKKQALWNAKIDVIIEREEEERRKEEEARQKLEEERRKLEEEREAEERRKLKAEDKPEEEEALEEPQEQEPELQEQAEAEIEPLPPFTLDTLQQATKKLEGEHRTVLCAQWEELQDDFKKGICEVMSWQRQHLEDIRIGLYSIRLRLCQFIERPHNFQGKVDAFVIQYNEFMDEYPAMGSQSATKDEMHKRLSALRENIKELCAQRRGENDAARTAVMESRFIETNVEVVARQATRLFQLEGARYVATCRLLSDSYHSIMGENLPEERDSAEQPDFFAGGVRVFNEEENAYTYPFLVALNAFTRNLVWPHKELGATRDMTGALEQQYVDFQEALLCERFLYIDRIARIEAWTRKRFSELDSSANRLYESIQHWIDLRENSERLAVGDVISYLRSLVEEGRHLEHQIRIIGCKVVHEKHVRLYEPVVPPAPRVKEQPPAKEWCSDQLGEQSEKFYAELTQPHEVA